MKALKYFACFLFLTFTSRVYSQDQKIYIFDPNGVSTSFQYTLSQLTEDSVFVADSLDDSIYNYDGLFLFINPPFALSQEEGNRLIQYTSGGNPVYLFTSLFPGGLDTVDFWNHIGIDDMSGLLISVPIDTVFGVSGQFTDGVVIDTSFMNGLIPVIAGNVDSILIGDAEFWEVNTTYVSGYDSLNVILDLYNLIDNHNFLERVLQKFELIPAPFNVHIQFFPQVDTALVNGGCTIPEFICKNLSGANERDSISIEPGFNTYFYYFDSTGTQIPLDNYYFIVIDSLDEYDYELWFHPKSWPPYDPVIIPFDSIYYSEQNKYDIQLIVKKNGMRIDSLSQPFHADFGLSVDDSGIFPNEFSLYQNYPNPFNPSTVISYRLPVSSNVTLKVYDVLGNEIATLVNEEKQPGTYEIDFNTSSIKHFPSSGIYFYQLRAGDFIETKKMVLMK